MLLKRGNCCVSNLVQKKIQIQNTSKVIKGQNQTLSCLKILSPQNNQASSNLTSGKATSVTAILIKKGYHSTTVFSVMCRCTMINAFSRNYLQNFSSTLDKSIPMHCYYNYYPLLNHCLITASLIHFLIHTPVRETGKNKNILSRSRVYASFLCD